MQLKMILTTVGMFLFLVSSSTSYAQKSDDPELIKGKPVMLFICSGQSNMAGGGGTKEYNKAIPNAHMPRKDIWYRVADSGKKDTAAWVPMGKVYGLGPEASFAVKMAEAYPKHTIAILKVSQGATPIKFWTPGKTSKWNSRKGYFKLKTIIPEVVADLKAKVKRREIPSFTIPGFVWMQGEGDANGTKRKDGIYKQDLANLMKFINTQSGQTNIPVIIGRISIQISPTVVRETGTLRVSKSKGGNLPDGLDHVNDGKKRGPIWYEEQLKRIRRDQEAFCKEYPKAAWVDIDDIELRDSYHYFPAGYAEMGNRFAVAMQKLLKKK